MHPVHAVLFFAFLCGTAVAQVASPASPVNETAARPFIVAPVVEGILQCVRAARPGTERAGTESGSYCKNNRYDAAAALADALDELEPHGPAGSVQVGYTLTVPLLDMYVRHKGGWRLDEALLDRTLSLISRVNRPVIIYLAANHFDTQGRLSAELVKDARNLMLLGDGRAPITNYFGNKVYPFTLSTDPALHVNRYRFEAVTAIGRKLAKLPEAARGRIVAVTMAGEMHQIFQNFESGMGAHQGTKVTDYSAWSVAGFRRWLAVRYGSIGQFNRQNGFAFADFDAVPVPAKDIRTDRLLHFAEHYDGFAGGTLPVSGWLWDPTGALTGLDLVVDGSRVGPVQRGFNRLDVYRALKGLDDPNVGFRYDLPYDTLSEGAHVVQVVGKHAGGDVQVARLEFNIVPRDQRAVPPVKKPELDGLKTLSTLPGVKSWLDLPRDGQDVYFNPVARDWNLFRDEQVRDFVAHFHQVALASGIAADKLYSHQLLPRVNSTWNPALFAADSVIGPDLPWRTGINLYGGAADSPWVLDFVVRMRLRDYGVPEFNPQQWKKPGVHLAAMEAQRTAGARFVSPYYMSITSRRKIKKMGGLKRLEIRPDNTVEGSDAFYRAIREFAAQ